MILDDLFPKSSFHIKEVKNKILIFQKKVNAYVTISGYVNEKDSKEVLSGVSIEHSGSNSSIISNAYGFYSLQVSKGLQELNYASLGYQTIQKHIELKNDTIIDVQMQPITEQLEETVHHCKFKCSTK